MERLTNILHYTLFSLILLVMGAFTALQSPYVQTAATQKVIEILEEKIDADISLESVFFKPVTTLLLKELSIVDRSPFNEEARDTLLYASNLSVRFSLISLLSPQRDDIVLKDVSIRDAQFNLVIEGGEWGINLKRMFKLPSVESPRPMKDADIITIHNITAENLGFTMRNFVTGKRDEKTGVNPNAIDWADMGVDNINLNAREFSISHGLFSAIVDHLSFTERSGWKLEHMSCTTVTGKGRALISGVELDDGISKARFDYSMTGSSKDFQDFVNKVVMDARIRKGSRFSLEMLSRFIPPLAPTPGVCLYVSGHGYGPVRDLRAKNIAISQVQGGVSMTVNGRVTGLPDVNAMNIEADVSPLRFSFDELCNLVNAIAPKARLDSDILAGKGRVTASVKAKGTLRSMYADLRLDQNGTGVESGLRMKAENLIGGGRMSFNGTLNADSLDISSLLGNEKLGTLSASTGFDIKLPHRGVSLEASIESLRIEEFRYNGYPYRNITGELSLRGGDLTADILSRDKAADADITVWSDKYSYNGAMMVRNLDLSATNFDKRGKSSVALNAYGHIDRDLSNLQGNANISGIGLTNGSGTHEVDDITISVTKEKEIYDVLLDSGIAHATFIGNGRRFSTELESYDSTPLLEYLMPGLYMEQGTHMQLSKFDDGIISGSVASGRIALGRDYIKDLDVQISGTTDSISAALNSSQIKLLGYVLNNNALNATKMDSLLTFGYTFSNVGDEVEKQMGHGDLNLDMTLCGDGATDLRLKPSLVNVNGRDWAVSESAIRVKGKEIDVDSFLIKSGGSWISVDGTTSLTEEGAVEAVLHNLDLSAINAFTDKNMGFRGTINSVCRLHSPLGDGIPLLETETSATGLEIGGTMLGDMTISSVADTEANCFNASVIDILDGRKAINGDIALRPYDKNIDARIRLNGFPTGFVQNILPSVFSEVDGFVSGTVGLSGPLDDFELSSRGTRLDNGLLRIAFTDVAYNVSGPFTVSNGGVSLDNMQVSDGLDGKGLLGGSFTWDRFRNPGMKLRMDVRNMKGLGVGADKASSVVYGNVFASGRIALDGPFGDLTLSMDVRAEDKSDLHIGLSSTAQASKGDLLTFTSPEQVQEDPYFAMLRKMDGQRNDGNSDFTVKIHAIADPVMDVTLDLGNGGFAAGLKGRGNGDVDLDIDTRTADFSITGNYILTEGQFDVNASSLVHRNFSIADGSSIKFGGDIMQSSVDLDATYQTKASIEALIADNEAVTNRRNVNCGIHIQNSLSNPDIKFSIDIPDLSPSAKSQVDGALSTDDKVQRQFLSLLLSGNFLPDEQSGIVNNSSLLFSNVSEIMANQVNSIFTRLNIPLDLGLNYQPTDNGTGNLFDVALSTQLFNNRVLIGGTFGNRQNMSSSKQTIFGDLDIQYKVLRSGSLRLNLFSHAADKYTNALDDSQKNGIGITWQQEFDQLPDWIKNLFSSKVQKEVLTRLMAEQARKTKTMILDE